MSKASPRRCRDPESRERKRCDILEAAGKVFAELGFADAEIDRVASRLGFAKGTLYLYFPSKQDLFLACVDDGMLRLKEAVQAAAVSDDPFEKIAKGIRAYITFFDENPHIVELLIQERASFKDRKRPTFVIHREANVGRWLDLYAGMRANGRIRDDLPVEHIVEMVGNVLYGAMFLNRLAGRRTTVDEQVSTILEVIFRGILSEDERRKRRT